MPERYAVSPTMLENVHLFRQGNLGAQAFKERLTERYVTTPGMMHGRAIHQSLEDDRPQGAPCHGFPVTIGGRHTPLPDNRRIVSRESWLRHELPAVGKDAVTVEITGRLDAMLEPSAVLDYKTTQHATDNQWRWLQASWQWRTYCVLAGTSTFVCRRYAYWLEGDPPSIFTAGPEDRVFHTTWNMQNVRSLCEDAVHAAREVGAEDALRSRIASRKQRRFLVRLIAQYPNRAVDKGIELSSAQVRSLTTFQCSQHIGALLGE